MTQASVLLSYRLTSKEDSERTSRPMNTQVTSDRANKNNMMQESCYLGVGRQGLLGEVTLNLRWE